jgi:hypothetical protein
LGQARSLLTLAFRVVMAVSVGLLMRRETRADQVRRALRLPQLCVRGGGDSRRQQQRRQQAHLFSFDTM